MEEGDELEEKRLLAVWQLQSACFISLDEARSGPEMHVHICARAHARDAQMSQHRERLVGQ
jgi:hypothetical protein